jgi:Flp pilus assembly protein TadG
MNTRRPGPCRRRVARGVTGSATQRGQAVVEAAGAMTFLLLLVIGILDFSPAVVWAAQLTQAARDGAAYARTDPTNTFEIRKRVVNSAPRVFGTMTDTQIAALTNTDISVVCATGLNGATKACSSAVGGDSITVTAARNYQTVTGLFAALLAAPLEISRSATSEIF